MELLTELWNFSISPCGIWLWALIAFIPFMAWADYRDAKARKRAIDHTLEAHRRKHRADIEHNRRTNPSGNDFGDRP